MKTITTLKEALEKIKQLKTTYYFRRGSEHVSIAAMDGFAVHSEDVCGEYNTAIISASPRSAVVDGYLVTDRILEKVNM